MSASGPVVVVVRPGANPRKSANVVRWVRWLLPAALLVVSQVPVGPVEAAAEVITLDADAVESGPLSVAAAIEKAVTRG